MIEANARANGVAVEVRSPFDLLRDELPWAPTVLANLTPVLHRELSARLERMPERLVAAGMLARYADDVAAAVRAAARARPRRRGRVGGGAARMIRLAIRVARDQAELVLAELAELAPAGLEERDVDPDTVEYAIYGAPGELPPLPDLRAAAGGALVDVSTTELADDWDVRWRTWHPAVVVEAHGRTLRVRPPWEAPQPGTIDVAIEPAQAFGTGAHETTRLSLALLMGLRADAALRWRTGAAAPGCWRSRRRSSASRPCSAATSRRRRWRRRATARATTASRSRSRAATCGARRARGRRR